MALSEEQTNWLETFFAQCDTNAAKLSQWETNFVTDQKTRYEEHGAEIRMSPKQWAVLNKIDAKINGEG